MIRFQFFPRSRGTNEQINGVINCFKSVENEIDSKTKYLVSNEVLATVRPYLDDMPVHLNVWHTYTCTPIGRVMKMEEEKWV